MTRICRRVKKLIRSQQEQTEITEAAIGISVISVFSCSIYFVDRMSVLQPDPARIIGTGHTSEVYAWDDGRVLKLFYEHRPGSLLDREFPITQSVKAIDVPGPAPFQLVV